jgi:CubicO group peptidase (beta-lactamase class C family)
MLPVPNRSILWTVVPLAAWLLAAPALGPADGPPAADAALPTESRAVSFDAAVKAAGELPRLRSLLVSRRGELVVEQYYNGARANRPLNVKSVSKTVLSALIGIAIERGLIESVHAPIAPFFPTVLGDTSDPRKREITIEDLLTMRSGLQSTSGRNYGAWVHSSNWVRHVLTRPVTSPRGISMDYSTGNTHLLSAILTKVSKSSTWEFARAALAEPLGITLAQWPRDPQGIYFGGNDMAMTPRQMLAFGELYLNRGRANGQQIVPEEWVETSMAPRTRSRWSQRLHGYGWWIRDLAGVRTYYAWGYGGQFIFVVPEAELVVVTNSSDSPGQGRHDHRDTIYDLVEDLIIEPVALAEGIRRQPGNVD